MAASPQILAQPIGSHSFNHHGVPTVGHPGSVRTGPPQHPPQQQLIPKNPHPLGTSNSPDSTTGANGDLLMQQQPSFLAYSAGAVPKTAVEKTRKKATKKSTKKPQNRRDSSNGTQILSEKPPNFPPLEASGGRIGLKPNSTALFGTASAPTSPKNVTSFNHPKTTHLSTNQQLPSLSSQQNCDQLPLTDVTNKRAQNDELKERLEKLKSNLKPEAPPCGCFPDGAGNQVIISLIIIIAISFIL